MITGSEVELHIKCFSEGTEKAGDEFRAMVRCEMPCLENMCIMNSIARSLEVQ